MATTSSAASSTLSRARIASVLLITCLAAYGIYKTIEVVEVEEATTSSALHRSNAVHRRRRRPTAYRPRPGEAAAETGGDGAADTSFFVEDTDDDEPANTEANAGAQEPPGIVLDAVVSPSDDSFASVSWAAPRNGQNMVSLLFSISEDATRRNSYVHRGTLCNGCGAVPIRGIRYRCANCADYDLCETCEAQGQHYRTHVFYKIKVPITNYAPRHLQTPFYPGNPDQYLPRPLPRDVASRLTTETTLDRPEIEAYWEQWTCIANTETRDDPDGLHLVMDRRTFDRYLIPSNANRYSAPNLIHDRMFAFYDQDKDGLISFPEYLQGLAYRKSKNKLKRIFKGYDINDDGYVDRRDFLRIFRSYYVLYKNMRKDMLESMDDSAVNGVDAHALIQGRQPLSSAFGRDGQFGSAHNRPRQAGKRMNDFGDLEMEDTQGVVLSDSEDHVERNDVFRNYLEDLRKRGAPLSLYMSMLDSPPRSMREFTDRVSARRAAAEPIPTDPNNNDINELEVDEDEGAEGDKPESQAHRSPEQKVDEDLGELMHERWRRRQFYTDEEEGAEAPSDWEDEEDIPKGNVEDEEGDDEPHRPVLSPRSRSSSKVRFAEDMDDYDTRSNPSTSSRSIPERWGGMEIAEAERDVGKDVLYQVTQQAFNELLDNLFKDIEDEAISSLTSSQTREKNRHLFTNKYFVTWAEQVDKLEKKTHGGEVQKKEDAREQHLQTLDAMEQRLSEQLAELESAPVDLDDMRQLDRDHLLAMSGYAVDHGNTVEPSEVVGTRMPSLPDWDAAPSSSTTLPQALSALQPNSSAPLPQRGSIPRSPRRGSETPSENLRRDMVAAFQAAEPFVGAQVLEEGTISVPAGIPPVAHGGRLNTDPTPYSRALAEYRDPTLPQFRPDNVMPAAPSPPSGTGNALEDLLNLSRGEHAARGHGTGKKERRRRSGMGGGSAEAKYGKAYVNVLLPELRNEMIEKMIQDPELPERFTKEVMGWNWMALYELRELEEVEKRARKRGGWARIDYQEFEDVLRMRDRFWKRQREWETKGSSRLPPGGRSKGAVARREKEMERMLEYLGSWIELCIQ